MEIQKRRLGKTDIEVTLIGLGVMQFKLSDDELTRLDELSRQFK